MTDTEFYIAIVVVCFIAGLFVCVIGYALSFRDDPQPKE